MADAIATTETGGALVLASKPDKVKQLLQGVAGVKRWRLREDGSLVVWRADGEKEEWSPEAVDRWLDKHPDQIAMF